MCAPLEVAQEHWLIGRYEWAFVLCVVCTLGSRARLDQKTGKIKKILEIKSGCRDVNAHPWNLAVGWSSELCRILQYVLRSTDAQTQRA